MSATSLSITMPTSHHVPKGRVLCVDDEPCILRALSWLLKKEFHVVTAQSGREALELIRSDEFDVVISDQRMPEMSGVDFLNEVKTLAPRAIRILLTGYSDLQSAIRSVNESEIFRFVTKPWDVEELPSIVAQAVAIAKGQTLTPLLPSTTEIPADRSAKILVLDDDEAIHAAVEMSAGDLTEVIHVTSPVDAFKALQNDDIGVILAARKLGSMDLTHLLCLLKRQHPQIVSIVLTETSDTALVCQLINQGQIFRLIAKPVKAGELRLALKSALSKRNELLDDPVLAARYQVEPLAEDAEHLLQEQLAGRAPPVTPHQAPPVSPDTGPVKTKPVTGFVGHFMSRLFRS